MEASSDSTKETDQEVKQILAVEEKTNYLNMFPSGEQHCKESIKAPEEDPDFTLTDYVEDQSVNDAEGTTAAQAPTQARLPKQQGMEASSHSTKETDQEVKQILALQEKTKITEEFCESLRLLYQQWDLELKEFKRKKEKLNNSIQEEEKILQQYRILQVQGLEELKYAYDKFIKQEQELKKILQNLKKMFR